MKKFAILFVMFAVSATLVMADEMADLQNAHKKALTYNGRGEVSNEMFFLTRNKRVFSALIDKSKEFSSMYTEDGDRKILWEVVKIEGGFKIIITVTILNQTFTKTITILFNNNEITIKTEGMEQARGCNYFYCAGKILACGVCLSNPLSSECMNCLGDAYETCIGCFQ